MRASLASRVSIKNGCADGVSFLAICGVLERAIAKGVIDIYYLKGGVAMELRFARAARTTKDFDLGLTGNRAERIRHLSEVLQLGFDDFTFRLKPEQYACVDWSECRPHVGGAVGSALLSLALKRKWVVLDLDSRALGVTSLGRREMPARFGLQV